MVNHNYDYYVMYTMYVSQFIGLLKTVYYYYFSFFDYRKPVIWDKKEIAFFCSYGNIPGEQKWDLKDLDKGCGGSEHSLLYLSKELSKKYKITIYNNIDKEMQYNSNIVFKPCKSFNFNDKFNIVISWRIPWIFSMTKFKSANNILWIHDASIISTPFLIGKLFGNYIQDIFYRYSLFSKNVNTIVVPSKFMEKMGINIIKEKNYKTNIVVIPNGIMDLYDINFSKYNLTTQESIFLPHNN